MTNFNKLSLCIVAAGYLFSSGSFAQAQAGSTDSLQNVNQYRSILPSTQQEVQTQDSDPGENQYNIYRKKARFFRNMAVIGASVGSLLTIYGFSLISREDKTVTDSRGMNHIVAGGPAGGGFVMLGLSAGIPLTIIGIRKSRKYKRQAERIEKMK